MYFELPTESGVDYVVMHSSSSDQLIIRAALFTTKAKSTRIWVESDTHLRLIKDRFNGPDSPVDTKEFMWIKLKSIDYDNYNRT